MSGQIEASFVIGDNEKARQLEEKQVGDRILKLFAVRLTVASAQAQGKLVTLSGNEEGTEKAKVSRCRTGSVRARLYVWAQTGDVQCVSPAQPRAARGVRQLRTSLIYLAANARASVCVCAASFRSARREWGGVCCPEKRVDARPIRKPAP